jgi:hypothetical protein
MIRHPPKADLRVHAPRRNEAVEALSKICFNHLDLSFTPGVMTRAFQSFCDWRTLCLKSSRGGAADADVDPFLFFVLGRDRSGLQSQLLLKIFLPFRSRFIRMPPRRRGAA